MMFQSESSTNDIPITLYDIVVTDTPSYEFSLAPKLQIPHGIKVICGKPIDMFEDPFEAETIDLCKSPLDKNDDNINFDAIIEEAFMSFAQPQIVKPLDADDFKESIDIIIKRKRGMR